MLGARALLRPARSSGRTDRRERRDAGPGSGAVDGRPQPPPATAEGRRPWLREQCPLDCRRRRIQW